MARSLAYKQTVLTALEDVENALVALQAAQARQREFRDRARCREQPGDPRAQPVSLRPDRLHDAATQAERSLLSARNGLVQRAPTRRAR